MLVPQVQQQGQEHHPRGQSQGPAYPGEVHSELYGITAEGKQSLAGQRWWPSDHPPLPSLRRAQLQDRQQGTKRAYQDRGDAGRLERRSGVWTQGKKKPSYPGVQAPDQGQRGSPYLQAEDCQPGQPATQAGCTAGQQGYNRRLARNWQEDQLDGYEDIGGPHRGLLETIQQLEGCPVHLPST